MLHCIKYVVEANVVLIWGQNILNCLLLTVTSITDKAEIMSACCEQSEIVFNLGHLRKGVEFK